MVQARYKAANAVGVCTAAQVPVLNMGTPLLRKDRSTGQSKLTIAIRQAADLKTYSPLSLATGSLSANQAGDQNFDPII